MFESFEVVGLWWTPEAPERKISGTLSYDPEDGLRLSLIGVLSNTDVFQSSEEFDVILGMPSNGQPITLLNCFVSQSNMGFPGFATETLFAHASLSGHHFPDRSSVTLKTVQVELSGLDEWCSFDGFTLSWSNESPFRTIIEYQKPSPIVVPLREDLHLTFDVSVKGPTKKYMQASASIEQSTILVFKYASEVAFEVALADIQRIRQFLTMATGKAPVLKQVMATTETNRQTVTEKVYHPAISIVYPAPLQTHRGARNLLPHELLFTLRDLEDAPAKVLETWYANAKLLKPIYDLYFAIRGDEKNMGVEFRFLSVCQALESFHRRWIGGVDLPEDEHQARLQAILTSCPNAHRDWLARQLDFSNQLRLRARLKQLLKPFQTSLVAFIPDRRRFVDRTVTLRNYLTHYDAKEPVTIDGEELYWLTERLALLLEASLLHSMGFDGENIASFFKRNPRIESKFSLAT